MEGKILGIGMQRTGTTTLYQALCDLGIRTAPNAIPLFYNPKDKLIEQYDAFMDNPVPLLYQQIDQTIPNCKFILTTRSIDSWLNSVKWLFEEELNSLSKEHKLIANEFHERLYGTIKYDRQIFENRWVKYHQQVKQYFEGRENDFLTLNIEENIGWSSLCGFLRMEIPNKPFPHKNMSTRT